MVARLGLEACALAQLEPEHTLQAPCAAATVSVPLCKACIALREQSLLFSQLGATVSMPLCRASTDLAGWPSNICPSSQPSGKLSDLLATSLAAR